MVGLPPAQMGNCRCELSITVTFNEVVASPTAIVLLVPSRMSAIDTTQTLFLSLDKTRTPFIAEPGCDPQLPRMGGLNGWGLGVAGAELVAAVMVLSLELPIEPR